MTLDMVAWLRSPLAKDTMFFDGEGFEIINKNTQAHYHELPDGRITLGGDVIEVSKEWVLGLQVTGIEARDNNLIIYVDG